MAFFDKIKSGLEKTRKSLANIISFSHIDSEFYDDLEEALILADVGAELSCQLVEELRGRVKEKGIKEGEEVKAELQAIVAERLSVGELSLNLATKPSVILVVGVNGVGKTTTIGKMAARLTAQGKKVLLCAGDTFRAAAADQLEIWAGRANCDIVRQHEGADPASVLFDAIAAAKARGTDVIICDTAGRLHNKSNLMNELEKIGRVIARELPDAAQETLMVLDAVTGQNGVIQAREFKKVVPITGVVLTKLDGTAKGGVVLAVTETLGVPVKYVGVGEQVDDLMPFDPAEFAEAML
ncbi:MAG: signal recognition particle-docking protein FtsY [Oscillospiraceae bacterium]|nr:signal recognition particle-docking protein FtsY [Oscillospiraceae bacterium]